MQLVTIYSDYCSSNPTTVSIGNCTKMTVGSFSVDCPRINGTLDDYTTISVAADKTSTQPSSSSTSTSSSPSSQQDPTISTCPFAPSSATSCPSTQTSTSMSKNSSPSSSTFSSPQIPSSLLIDLHSTSSFPPSTSIPSFSPSPSSPLPSPSQTSQEIGNNERLSRSTKTILGVVISVVSSIVVVYGVFWYVRRRRSVMSAPQSSGPTAEENSQRSSSSYPLDCWDYVRRNSRDPDRLSLDNENPSIPPYYQGRI